jgi:glycosyltransferase involved in cell wall biosynthesis
MQAGVPAIVSNISPLNEIICPGTSGLVAEPENPRSFANAVITLFENREYMHRIAAEGQRRVATEFSQERMVEKTLGYYHDVIDRRTAATL